MNPVTMTQDEIDQAHQYLFQLNMVQQQFGALASCGYNCADMKARVQSIIDQLNKLLANFGGPGQ